MIKLTTVQEQAVYVDHSIIRFKADALGGTNVEICVTESYDDVCQLIMECMDRKKKTDL